MIEMIVGFILILILGILIGYFVVRPLIAIGDIPYKMDELTESIKELNETLRSNKT